MSNAAEIIFGVLGTIGGDLFAALVHGDKEAYERVRDIIPTPLKSEAKLEHENARLRVLQESKKP